MKKKKKRKRFSGFPLNQRHVRLKSIFINLTD